MDYEMNEAKTPSVLNLEAKPMGVPSDLDNELISMIGLMFFDAMTVPCVASDYARCVIKLVRDYDRGIRRPL
jgi:hypothetical protein